jgi:polar amino acid transport system substrate-binding protein
VKRLVPVARVAFAATLLAVAGCSAPDRTPTVPTTVSGAASAPAPAASRKPACPPAATASYQALSSVPSGSALPAGSLEKRIAERGRLIVGVSSDTRLLGARNLSNNQFEGFDVLVARRVAQAIFGSSDASRIQYRAISVAQRIPFLKAGGDNGGVDLVARAMTMTCDRWNDVGFAGPYFTSYLKFLVPKASGVQGVAGLKGKRVCATSGSTTLAAVTKQGVLPVGVPLTTDCMVLWQQGQVDAVAADDAILAGLAAQDPSAKIVGDQSLESEPYGLGISKDHPEFVQYVNAVLDQMRNDGSWQRAYQDSGLAGILKDRTQPAATYTRPLP